MENNEKIEHADLLSYFSKKTRLLNVPFSGTFELTPRCNMNCKMCYIRMTEKEMANVGRELTVDEWISIAKEAVNNGMTMLLFTGGEAMLYKEFKKLYLSVREMGVFISINTNGTLFNDEWLSFFEKYPPAKFNITIYGGCNQTYENLCGNPRGFDQLKKNIVKLQELNIEILLNCTITKQNKDDLKNIFEFGKEHNLTIHATTYNFPPMRKEGIETLEVSRMSTKEAAYARIKLNWYELGEKRFVRRLNYIHNYIEKAKTFKTEKKELIGDKILCAAGRSNFWITWDGRMLPCGMIPDYSVSLKNKNFEEAWNDIVIHSSKITLAPECKSCYKKDICLPCAAKIKSETGYYNKKSDYLCEYTDEYLSLVEKALAYLNK